MMLIPEGMRRCPERSHSKHLAGTGVIVEKPDRLTGKARAPESLGFGSDADRHGSRAPTQQARENAR